MHRRRWFDTEELPINILSHLPARKLNELKLVSKEWRTLISDRGFIKLQLRSEPVTGFFFQDIFDWTERSGRMLQEMITYVPIEGAGETGTRFFVDVIDFIREDVILQSTNKGLVCCRSHYSVPNPMIYVCNPLNKDWTRIKCPIFIPKNSSIAIAFDPVRDPIDVYTDFTLVAVNRTDADEIDVEDVDDSTFVFHLYSSKTRIWEPLVVSTVFNFILAKNRGILVDGDLCWLVNFGYEVLLFDYRNKMSLLVSGPIPGPEFNWIPEVCIGECQGKLNYAVCSEHGVQIWSLEDKFDSRWELKYSTTFDQFEAKTGLHDLQHFTKAVDDYPWLDPLALNGVNLFLRIGNVVYSFDRHNLSKICDYSTLTRSQRLVAPVLMSYNPSLVPIDFR